MKQVKQTQVFIVADVSGSMAGAAERTMRRLIRETVDVLAAQERTGDQVFEVQLLPFSSNVIPGRLYVASAVPQAALDEVNTNRVGLGGVTALRDAIGRALELSAVHRDVPTLISVFTDGRDNSSVLYSAARLRSAIQEAEERGNVTITVAGPAEAVSFLSHMGVPADNFRAWDGGARELEDVAKDHVAAVSTYTQQRGTGQTRSGVFYADPSKVTPSGVRQATKLVVPTDIRTVSSRMGGRSIPDFYGKDFRQGHHYYQLVKPEYIQDDKELVILIKPMAFGHPGGPEYRIGSRAVRALLGLPETGRIRVHPSTNDSPYEVYVRSDSPNRKVVAGQRFLTIE